MVQGATKNNKYLVLHKGANKAPCTHIYAHLNILIYHFFVQMSSSRSSYELPIFRIFFSLLSYLLMI
jgi:hypothetical protein